MLTIRTIFVFILVCISVVILFPFGIIALALDLIGFKKTPAFLIYKLAQGWGRALLFVSGSKVTVIGRENIPKTGGVCLVSNHGSIFDIVLNLAYVGRPFGFIAKKELLFIPFLDAWIAILGGLFIDRKDLRKGLETIKQGAQRLKNGGGILIFPEGHRTRTGEMLPFRAGSLRLATQSGVPIIPVAISNSYEFFEKHFRINPVPMRIEYCAPVYIENLPPENRKLVLSDMIHDTIQAALDRGRIDSNP